MSSTVSVRLRDRLRRELRAQRDAAVERAELRAECEDLAVALGRAGGRPARRLGARVAMLLDALDRPAAPQTPAAMADALAAALQDAGPAQVWLALAVLSGRLPLDEQVLETTRLLRLDGPRVALSPVVARAGSVLHSDSGRLAPVTVVRGAVVLDVHHTSRTQLATGIQRVARETARRWQRDHRVELVGWTDDYTALQRLDPVAAARAVGAADRPTEGTAAPEPVLVPWQCTYLTLELATEAPRTARMLALARRSGNRTGAVGFDCVPLTTAETAAQAMGGAFAQQLAALRHMDRIATISAAAAREYCGWQAMLAGTGLAGPRIRPVPLPVEATPPGTEDVEEARRRFAVGRLPLVLCVGSHEPRKNHLAVLHAAERLWRDGVRFSLLFVGGNAWHSERFVRTLTALRDQGRPIASVSALDDRMLWAAYRVAHLVLFPSLNEGFGLPVAEALATGTPVITSGYGSMAEIAEHGGALLVDPRDDADLAAALRRLLAERVLHAELAEQARRRPLRSWDEYAGQLWAELVER